MSRKMSFSIIIFIIFLNLCCTNKSIQVNDHFTYSNTSKIENNSPKSLFPSDLNITSLPEMHIVDFPMNYSISVAIASLQGILNRQDPKLFVIRDSNDEFWCDYIIERLQPNLTIYHTNFTSLINTFKDNISGSIQYNPVNLHTRNIAIPFCAAEDAILVDPSLAEWLQIHFGIPESEYNFATRWENDTAPLEMYKWAFENYLTNDTFNTGSLALQGPDKVELIDLLIRDSIFTFWNINTLECSSTELNLFLEVMGYFPKNSPILGYPYATGINEWNTVRLISEAGLYLLPSDFSANLAFCSHLNFGKIPYKQNRTWISTPPELQKKLYVTFLISDGDNLQFLEGQMQIYWKQKIPGEELPVGWSISPYALKYAPHLVDFYYGNATESDYFLAGPSGAGYIYPDSMKSDVYEEYLNSTKYHMSRMDLTEIWALGLSLPVTISQMVESTGVHGIFEGYNDNLWDKPRLTYNNTPVFTVSRYGIEASDLYSSLEAVIDVNSWQMPLFIPIYVHVWSQGLEFIRTVMNYCENHSLPIDFVRPDQFIYLYNQYASQKSINTLELLGTIFIIGLLALSSFLIWHRDSGAVKK